MSGLLRRIKRSRPSDAGEPPVEGQAAAPEGAAPTSETPGATPGPDAAPATGEGAWSAGEPARAVPGAEAGVTRAEAQPPPILRADPATPAGLELGEAQRRPPAGRRGRLRRRLRYLRRARELMLRDLGGLLYEVHRTGGGNVDAHATVIGAKVERIAGLDAEAHALETALAAPRAESVVFQPGIGGTCNVCGSLYGSDAGFCASCGTAVDAVPAAPVAAPGEVASEAASERRRRRFWPPRRRAAAAAAAADEPTDATAVMAPAGAEDSEASPDPAGAEDASPTSAPGSEAGAPALATPGLTPTHDVPPDGADSPPAPVTPPADTADPPADAGGDDAAPGPEAEPPDRGAGARNGHVEGPTPPPDRPAADPLTSRESRP